MIPHKTTLGKSKTTQNDRDPARNGTKLRYLVCNGKKWSLIGAKMARTNHDIGPKRH